MTNVFFLNAKNTLYGIKLPCAVTERWQVTMSSG